MDIQKKLDELHAYRYRLSQLVQPPAHILKDIDHYIRHYEKCARSNASQQTNAAAPNASTATPSAPRQQTLL